MTNMEEVLHRRADLLRERKRVLRHEDDVYVTVLAVAGRFVGVPMDALREIVPLGAVTPLPAAPAWLLGVTQVRGDLVAVATLATLLGCAATEQRVLAILETEIGALGLAADRVVAVRGFDERTLVARTADDERAPIISKITQDLVEIIDVAAIAALGEHH